MKYFGITIFCMAVFLVSANQSFAQTLTRVTDRGADTLIVFIHGVRDDGVDTWTNRRTGAVWPELLEADPVFDGTDIVTYRYPSDVWKGGGLSIGDVADDLSQRFRGRNFSGYSNLVFVAHSMGGLIARSLLLKDEAVAEKTGLVFFLATPSGGANLADIATRLSGSNRQLRGLRELENNNFLSEQVSAWQGWRGADKVKSYCAFETINTLGFLVVPPASAQFLCNQKPIPVAENHSGIAKPQSPDSIVYIAFKTAYQEVFDIPVFSPALQADIVAGEGWVQPEQVVVARTLTLASDLRLAPGSFVFADQIDLGEKTLLGEDLTVVANTISRGTIDASGGTGADGTTLVVAVGRLSATRLMSRGGDGRNGVDGDDGFDGNRGARGRNGNCDGFGRYRGAKRGKDGEDGSRGTDGQDGGDGGKGGTVFLLSLSSPSEFDTVVSGGAAGAGGRMGQGGRGGAGGAGGRGCTGLGGSQSNAASGADGLDGKDGQPGQRGVEGARGQVWFKQIDSLSDLSKLLPESNVLRDYSPRIRRDIQSRIQQN